MLLHFLYQQTQRINLTKFGCLFHSRPRHNDMSCTTGAQNGFGQRLLRAEIDKTTSAVRREICISFCGVTKVEVAPELRAL